MLRPLARFAETAEAGPRFVLCSASLLVVPPPAIRRAVQLSRYYKTVTSTIRDLDVILLAAAADVAAELARSDGAVDS